MDLQRADYLEYVGAGELARYTPEEPQQAQSVGTQTMAQAEARLEQALQQLVDVL